MKFAELPSELLSVTQEFWSHVQISLDEHSCWPWQGALFKTGYGAFRFRGKTYRAHRVAYFIIHGKDPDNALHRCDNRCCVRPTHILSGTQQENLIDARQKGRLNPARGHRSGRATLNEQQVAEIRQRLAIGQSHRAIAVDMGVGRGQVWSIKALNSYA